MSKRKNTFGENTAVTLLGPTGYDNVIKILENIDDLMALYDALIAGGENTLLVDNLNEDTVDAGITIDGQTLIKDGEVTSVTFNGAPITALGSATQFLAGDGTYQTLVETDISDLDKYTQAQVDTAISAATAAMNELSELTDTVITTPAVRHALMYDGVDSWDNRLLVELDISDLDKYTQSQVDTNIGVVNTALGTHTGDTTIHFTQAAIDITASQVNDFSTAVNALVGSTDVDGLNNVTITTPALGNILVYNTVGTVWENQTLASQDIATLTAMATADGLRVATAGDTMDSAADLTFAGGGEVLGLPATPSATGAASKEYVDTQIGGAALFVENVTHSFITGGTNAGGNLDITGLTDDSFIAGVNAVQTLTSVLGSIVIGHNAGGLLATGTLTGNTAVGFEAISGHATGSVAPGDYNSVFGYQCGAHAKGEHNVFMGYRAGFGVNAGWSGDKNVALGSLALDSASGAVSTTVAVGAGSFGLLYGTSSENVAVGNNAGAVIGGSSVQNTFLGAEAGSAIALGQRNVCVGYDAGPVSGVHNDELYISNTQTATPLIFGDFATPKVTINGALEATGAVFVNHEAPTYNWVESGYTADNKNWDMVADAGVMYLRTVNDAYTIAGNILKITRTGTTVDEIEAGANVATTATAPTADDHLTRKDYVVNNFVADTGGTMTSDLFVDGGYSVALRATGSPQYPLFSLSDSSNQNRFRMQYNHDGSDATAFLKISAINITECVLTMLSDGNVTLEGGANVPTAAAHLTRKDYLDNNFQPILTTTASIELNSGGTGDRNAVLDLHACDDAGHSDYSGRLIRASGVNGILSMENRGTGGTLIRTDVGGTAKDFTFSQAGDLGLPQAPTTAPHATRKDYVDTVAASRNVIINGNFDVWQRGTSVALATGLEKYIADRWYGSFVGAAGVTMLRSTDVPTVGQSEIVSTYSLQMDITTADTSIAATDLAGIGYRVEGHDAARLLGTDATVSFWVKAAKTGVHCVGVRNSGGNRSYTTEYTIAAANTWEKHTVTFPLTEHGGTWSYTNGMGLDLFFCMAAGTNYHTTADAWQTGNAYATSNQVNELDNVANNFRIAQVQFEKGDVATPFECILIADEIARCQRYYQIGSLVCSTAVTASPNTVQLIPSMRITPTTFTFTPVSGTSGVWTVYDNSMVYQSTAHTTASGASWTADAEL